MTRTIKDVQKEIGAVINPADGRSWYLLIGPDFGDFDTTVGHYRRTNPDGTLAVIRDDTMQEARCQSRPPHPLSTGWRHIIEEDE